MVDCDRLNTRLAYGHWTHSRPHRIAGNSSVRSLSAVTFRDHMFISTKRVRAVDERLKSILISRISELMADGLRAHDGPWIDISVKKTSSAQKGSHLLVQLKNAEPKLQNYVKHDIIQLLSMWLYAIYFWLLNSSAIKSVGLLAPLLSPQNLGFTARARLWVRARIVSCTSTAWGCIPSTGWVNDCLFEHWFAYVEPLLSLG